MGFNERRTEKHTCFTIEQIKDYLLQVNKMILEGRYTVARNPNRQENIDFSEQYKINTMKEQEILLSLQYDDFCYAVDNDKPEFAYEKLYIFCKNYELDNWGELERVDIYIKINITQTRKGDDFMIVISFHKLNKPITFLFK